MVFEYIANLTFLIIILTETRSMNILDIMLTTNVSENTWGLIIYWQQIGITSDQKFNTMFSNSIYVRYKQKPQTRSKWTSNLTRNEKAKCKMGPFMSITWVVAKSILVWWNLELTIFLTIFHLTKTTKYLNLLWCNPVLTKFKNKISLITSSSFRNRSRAYYFLWLNSLQLLTILNL